METYAAPIGLGSPLQSYLDGARAQIRLNQDGRLGAPAINDCVRASFAKGRKEHTQ